MLVNQTVSKLEALGLSAMAAGLLHHMETPGPWSELCFEDRLGLLADAEADARDTRRLANRLKAAKLRYPAAVEDIDFRTPRGLDRGVIASLAGAGWVSRGHNVLITGATGCGKSFVACALANAALRQGHTALYLRTPRLLEELARGRADGRYVRTLTQLARVSLLVLDDFLLSPAPPDACRDLLEVIEDRSQRRSTAGQPASGGALARGDGRSHPGRGDPGPPVPGLAPHHHERPLPAAPPAGPDRRSRTATAMSGSTRPDQHRLP